MYKNHPFHMVENSPWPLIISLNLLNSMISMILWMHMTEYKMLIISMLILLINSFQWWRDITRESTFQGNHTMKVTLSMKLGMILFIISEIMFFISFFWSFLHSSISPNIEIGMKWPPESIHVFNPISTPLLNTTILLSSGISVTWAHHSLIKNNIKQTIKSLTWTIILGIIFSILQMIEYLESSFSLSDSIYGSTFFLATGFHGLHVLIGTTLLTVMLTRLIKLHFSKTHHFGFEAAAWYWHFVDVVWLFLYLMVYWWGS
uniref:Cytochrome c oxidase subunit 3 n=1 Tax=Trixagus sp. TRI01 TaxID=1205587 RepID=A0A0S2MQA0_9COLE|nr:cytochrome c oxidase subunit 3 [Trixagus sp. TRI01]